jgi:hypothetical protein
MRPNFVNICPPSCIITLFALLLQINRELPTDSSLVPAKLSSPLYHFSVSERTSLATAPALDKPSDKSDRRSSSPQTVKVSGRRPYVPASTSPDGRLPLATATSATVSHTTQIASARAAIPKLSSSGTWWTSPATKEGLESKERHWRVQLTAAEARIRILEDEVRFWKARCLEYGDPK